MGAFKHWSGSALRYVDNLFDRLLTGIDLVLMIGVGMMTFSVTVSVFGRYLFNKPIMGVDDLSGWLLVMLTFLGFAAAEKRRENIRVGSVVDHLPAGIRKPLMRYVYLLQVAIVLACLVFSTFLVQQAIAWKLKTPTVYPVPLWMLEVLLPIGYFLFLVQQIRNIAKKQMGGKEEI